MSRTNKDKLQFKIELEDKTIIYKYNKKLHRIEIEVVINESRKEKFND